MDAGQPYFEEHELSCPDQAPTGLSPIQVSTYVGDTYCTMDAVLHNTTLGGYYYVSPGPLLDALGASWTVTDGILTITTKQIAFTAKGRARARPLFYPRQTGMIRTDRSEGDGPFEPVYLSPLRLPLAPGGAFLYLPQRPLL